MSLHSILEVGPPHELPPESLWRYVVARVKNGSVDTVDTLELADCNLSFDEVLESLRQRVSGYSAEWVGGGIIYFRRSAAIIAPSQVGNRTDPTPQRTCEMLKRAFPGLVAQVIEPTTAR